MRPMPIHIQSHPLAHAFVAKARFLGCMLLVASLALPIWAVPPGDGSPVAEARPTAVQPEFESAAVQSTVQTSCQSGSGTPSFRLPSVLPLLNFGFMLFALVGLPVALAQPPMLPLTLWSPALNLSAPDPVSVAVAGGVQLALGRANGTRALPPLGALNEQLAASSPAGVSPLATLSEPPEGSSPIRLDPLLPGSTRVGGAGLSLGTDMQEAIQNLNAAQLQEAGRLIQSIGHQLLGDAGLAYNNKTVVGALVFAGDDLLAIGDAFEAAAAHAEGLAVQEVILGLEDKANQAQAASSQDATGPDGTLDPSLIYGTWERVATSLHPTRIFYRFTRSEFVKFNTTTTNRRKAVRNEVHPGTVTAFVSYDLPEDGACPGGFDPCPDGAAPCPGEDEACATTPLAPIQVTILIEQLSGKTLTLDFTYLKAQGQSLGKAPQTTFDVLVERDGAKKAFVKISAT